MRDTTKIIALSGTSTAFAKAQIQIHSSAGEGLVLFSVVISLRISVTMADYSLVVGPRQNCPLWLDWG